MPFNRDDTTEAVECALLLLPTPLSILVTGHDCSVAAVVQGFTLRNRICSSRILVPAQSVLWVCRLWRYAGGTPVLSKASHWVCWPWYLLWVALPQAKFSHCLCTAQRHLS